MAIAVAAVMSTPLVPASPAAAAQIQVGHSAISCIVADQYPQLEATAPAGANVRSARAYFHSALTNEFYYVEGELSGGRWVFRLPRPNLGAGPITYYIEFTAPDGRTADYTAAVVASASECQNRAVAPFAPAGSTVFGPGGVIATPPGFGGVGVASTIGTAGTVGTVATGKGISAGLLIAGLAVVAGATVAIIALGDDDEPASPSR
jgi:hypothetical protein